MKLLQTLESIDDKLGKLLDRMSEGVVHTNQGERHTARTVSSPSKEMTTAIKLDTTQAQKALDLLSNTVSKAKDEYKELQEYKADRMYRLAEAYTILKDKRNKLH